MWSFWLAACSSEAPRIVEPPPSPEPVVEPAPPGTGPFGIQLGEWQGRFETQGGPLPFRFEVGERCRTQLLVGEQSFDTEAACEANTLSLRFPPYLGSLTATIGEDGKTLRGQYAFQRGGEWRQLKFDAAPKSAVEREPVPDGAPTAVNLALEGKEGSVLLEMTPKGDEVFATVSSPTGDWGPLEGGWTPEGLRLSGFDGSHAFLIVLAPDEEGSLEGTIWSRDADGRPARETDASPDLDGWDALALDRVDLSGMSLQRIGGEVEALPTEGARIVHLTGTWCPNCNDAAPVLESIAARHPELTVLGLSWEAGAPAGKADRQILRFRQKYGISHPLYRLDGAPPFLDPVPAWPTTLFVRDDGTVAAAHVGFLGPATGPRFTALVERYEREAAALGAP